MNNIAMINEPISDYFTIGDKRAVLAKKGGLGMSRK